MPKEIKWSRLADIDLMLVTEYLVYNFGKIIADDFLDILDECTDNISKNPQTYRMINKKLKVRKCVVTKHNSLYYHEIDNHVEVIRLFDNRQDPKKLKF
jgi:plasmid stabilization system protein ParE